MFSRAVSNPPGESNRSTLNTSAQTHTPNSNVTKIPPISLPKSGGALKSMDEEFSVNAANSTVSFSIPWPISPKRSGFSPSLSLSYNAGIGNRTCGIGWGIDLPSIQRRTEKLPIYRDREDPFIFSGIEDLGAMLDNWLIPTAEFSIWVDHKKPQKSSLINA